MEKCSSTIHRLNPQVVALAPTHPPATISWGTFRRMPEIYDQESCILAGDVGIVEEDYTGTAAGEDRVRPLPAASALSAAVRLPDHGAPAHCPSIQVALMRMMPL